MKSLRRFKSEERWSYGYYDYFRDKVLQCKRSQGILRRGLRGFVDGKEMSALADSGADHNIITLALAKEMGLAIVGSPARFELGNSKLIKSIGHTRLNWTFAKEPSKIVQIICHVAPRCTYDLVLGRKFLEFTRTLSKYRDRLTYCLPLSENATSINSLGNSPRRLVGTIGRLYQAFAIPDTGADRNVMDMQYAQTHGFSILKKPENPKFLQFADLSVHETVGQVKTTWTFENGDVEQVKFEVLEDCVSDVILGEEILWQHDIFNRYGSSLIHLDMDEEGATMKLAPFAFFKEWQGSVIRRSTRKEPSKASTSCSSTASPLMEDTRELRRRDSWNFKHGFEGHMATPEEQEAENRRRREYADERHRNATNEQRPRIPSIATSSLNPRSGRRRAHADARNPNCSEGQVPRIPSITTSPVDLGVEGYNDGS